MPTAKPRYDGDGSWKTRYYTEAQWDGVCEQARRGLRRFYPDKGAKAQGGFADPADLWADQLLSEAHDVLSNTEWTLRRLTKEEMRAEQQHTFAALRRAEKCLSGTSHDLTILLGADADLRACCDQITALIQQFDRVGKDIPNLPKARKIRDIQHDAAMEIAVRILRDLKRRGISTAATAGADAKKPSAAVVILRVIGDALGLRLADATWKTIVTRARNVPPVRRPRRATKPART